MAAQLNLCILVLYQMLLVLLQLTLTLHPIKQFFNILQVFIDNDVLPLLCYVHPRLLYYIITAQVITSKSFYVTEWTHSRLCHICLINNFSGSFLFWKLLLFAQFFHEQPLTNSFICSYVLATDTINASILAAKSTSTTWGIMEIGAYLMAVEGGLAWHWPQKSCGRCRMQLVLF